MALPRTSSVYSLPDSALLAILRLLPPLERRVVVPLVCKRFAALAAVSTDLWEQVQLAIPADFRQSVSLPDLFSWFVRREGLVRSLHVSIGTDDAWAPLLALLGVVGRGLEHLRVAGDGQSCAVAGCTAPWLALTPNLRSLELDDVCDHSIGDALWPSGAPRRLPLLHARMSCRMHMQQPCLRRLYGKKRRCATARCPTMHALLKRSPPEAWCRCAGCSLPSHQCRLLGAGLTRLELSYCGEEGLYSIPSHVGCVKGPGAARDASWQPLVAAPPRHA